MILIEDGAAYMFVTVTVFFSNPGVKTVSVTGDLGRKCHSYIHNT